MFVSTELIKFANSRSHESSLISLDISVGSTNIPPSLPAHPSQLKHSNPLAQPECSLVFGLWLPGVAGRSDQPHCHHVQMLMHKSV